MRAEVVSKKIVASGVFELEFSLENKESVVWEPGAHVDIHLSNGLIRQFSLMEGLIDPKNFRIAVQLVVNGRGGSKFIFEKVELGHRLLISRPRNHFHFGLCKTVSFIAAGIGITPIVPMMKVAQENNIEWRLHFLGKNKEQIPYSEELKSLYPGRVNLYFSQSGNRFSVTDFSKEISHDHQIYACGPETLMTELDEKFGNSSNFHSERFSPKIENFQPNRAFEVIAEKSKVRFKVDADESILVAADFEGIPVEGDCLEGTCGACVTRVIKGDVEHRDSILSNFERSSSKQMMICVSRSLGETICLDL